MKKKIIPKNKGGRPKKEIDPKLVYDLAKIHCTVDEIASIAGCHRDTLYANFSDTMRNGYDDGKKSLKRKMFEVALEGNTTMMVWLSKQYLGHKDKQPEEVPNTVINVNVKEIP